MSAFSRYVDKTEGLVINEEMLVSSTQHARKLGLDCKKKILSTVEEDGL